MRDIQKQKDVIKRLKDYKIKNRLTAGQLSDELKIPQVTLYSWLSGQRMPSEIAMNVICDFLNDTKESRANNELRGRL